MRRFITIPFVIAAAGLLVSITVFAIAAGFCGFAADGLIGRQPR